MAWVATGAAGPSPAPRTMRQAINISRLTVPSIGNCTSDQMIAMTSSVCWVFTRLVMKPTTMAERANRKKNDEPISPNCSGESFSSAMIGWAASPTTTLSAKLISMKRKIRAVMPHAPFSGRSWTVTGALLPSPVEPGLEAMRQEPAMPRKDGAHRLTEVRGPIPDDKILRERKPNVSDAHLCWNGGRERLTAAGFDSG